MVKFDITIEPWLPVKALSGEAKNASLLGLLEDAHKLKAFDGLNPMEEYSVFRFFSVFLTAVFRPETWEDKLELLDEGLFDMKKVRGYIDMCRSEGVSFDIFDEKRPFMQATPNPKYDQDKNLTSPAVLDNTRASGNNHIHYDHTLEGSVVIPPADAFRALLTAQIFSVSKTHGSTSHYYTNVYGAPPTFYLPKGDSLFESLTLAMPTIASEGANEPEIWRNTSEIIPNEEITSVSSLYGMFFPSRRIRLLEDGGNVKQIYYQPGLHFIGFAGWTDPHVAYRLNKDNAMVSVKPNLDREGWRNLGTIAASFAENERGVPTGLKEYSKILKERGHIKMEIMTFGAITDNASFHDLQRGTFTLDMRIIASKKKTGIIGSFVSFMEKQENELYRKLKMILVSEKRLKRTQKTKAKPKENEIKKTIHVYYSQCEKIFYECADQLAIQEENLENVEIDFQQRVKRLLQTVLNDAENIYCSTADEMIRAAKARNRQLETNKMKGR